MAKTIPTNQQSAPSQHKAGNGGGAHSGSPLSAPAGSDPTKPPKKGPRSGARKKLNLVWHPDLKPDPATGEPTAKLKAIPADFKTTVYKQLNIKHFETPEAFYELMAKRFDEKAERFRKMAKQAREIGNVPPEAKAGAKKMQTLIKRLDDLKAEMSGKGVDVEAMLKLLMEQKAAKETAATTEADAVTEQAAPAGTTAA